MSILLAAFGVPAAPAAPAQEVEEKPPAPAAESAAAEEPPPKPAPEKPKPPQRTTREIINSLSAADLQEIVALLRAEYVHPAQVTDPQMARAIVEGLVHRLESGLSFVAAKDSGFHAEDRSFFAEILDNRIGYLRLGSLKEENVKQLDASIEKFTARGLNALILDLRATPYSSNFSLALDVARRFVEKGRLLFSMKKPGAQQERIFTSNRDPAFDGALMILVDETTAGAAELIAAVLRQQAKAMLVGETTAGRAAEFVERKLTGGEIIRIAVSEAVLPERGAVFPQGVQPDFKVPLEQKVKEEIFRRSFDDGISQFVFDRERPRMNEAALVSGAMPELEAYRQAQEALLNGELPEAQLKDKVLQRAVDLITTIAIYERAGAKK